jgi:hypothetical protein
MLDLRRYLSEGLKHEPPLVHARMRHREARLVDHFISEQEQIEVQRPRPAGVIDGPNAPELSFNPKAFC